MACFNDSHFTDLDIRRRLTVRPADDSHMPKLHDLDSASSFRIRHRPEKLVDQNIVSGFFHNLSFGGGKRMFASIELTFRQDPRLVPSQSHDCEPWSGPFL